MSEYIDGRLQEAERADLEAHLRACQDCAADLDSLRQTVALMRRLPEMAPPRSFAVPVPASLPARQRRERRGWLAWPSGWSGFQYLRLATAAATGLFVVFALAALLASPMGAPPPRMASAPVTGGSSAYDRAPEEQPQVPDTAPPGPRSAPQAAPAAPGAPPAPGSPPAVAVPAAPAPAPAVPAPGVAAVPTAAPAGRRAEAGPTAVAGAQPTSGPRRQPDAPAGTAGTLPGQPAGGRESGPAPRPPAGTDDSGLWPYALGLGGLAVLLGTITALAGRRRGIG